MQGIIVQSFGSTYREAYRKSVGYLFRYIEANFTDYYVVESYSSEIVRKRIEARDQDHIFNIKEALADMEKKGIKDIFVLNLYVIEGHEYNKVIEMAKAYNADGRLNIKFSRGLFAGPADIKKVGDFFIDLKEKSSQEALVFMGHGSNHDEDIKYSHLQEYLDQENQRVYIGTVEGEVSLDHIIERLRAENIKSLEILPLMLVAGDHAQNDMAGDEEDSWKSILTSQGFATKLKTKGLCEFDQFNNLFINKLREIL
ncbi:MAG: sirohydrochlorin cobaltochelatase [Bacillota bacterium]|nr:sirohydrochlorin cobaltochelatase [Bacillota bacterium]